MLNYFLFLVQKIYLRLYNFTTVTTAICHRKGTVHKQPRDPLKDCYGQSNHKCADSNFGDEWRQPKPLVVKGTGGLLVKLRCSSISSQANSGANMNNNFSNKNRVVACTAKESDLLKNQPIFDAIPDALKASPRWVTALKKKPYCSASINCLASTAEPDTWSDFGLTQTAYEEGGKDGIGFVFNGDGIVGIDLDDCVVDGQPSDDAIAILKQAGCGYVEYSQSGTGLHAYGYCQNLNFKKRVGNYNGVKTEIYNTNCFFVVTGAVYQAGGLTQYSDLQSIIDGLGNSRPRLSGPVTEETEVTKAIASVSSVSSASSVIFPNSCVPFRKGMRHNCIFNLARHLKSQYPNSTGLQLKTAFTDWWQQSLPIIGTKDFDESWTDFLVAWGKVMYPAGQALNLISIGLPDPSTTNHASIYGIKGANLLELCIRLDKNQKDNWNNEPFPLSCRVAGDVLGICRNHANQLLTLLTNDGSLELVSKGNTVRANRYRLNPKFCRIG